jgi:hypothetical protein
LVALVLAEELLAACRCARDRLASEIQRQREVADRARGRKPGGAVVPCSSHSGFRPIVVEALELATDRAGKKPRASERSIVSIRLEFVDGAEGELE